MYKVVYQGMIIDVIEVPYYVRWIERYNRFFPSDPTSAHCIGSSNEETYYHVEGMPDFEKNQYKTVKLIQIDEKEFLELQSQIITGDTVYFDEVEPTEEEVMRRRIESLENKIVVLSVQNQDLVEQLEAAKILLGVE